MHLYIHVHGEGGNESVMMKYINVNESCSLQLVLFLHFFIGQTTAMDVEVALSYYEMHPSEQTKEVI